MCMCMHSVWLYSDLRRWHPEVICPFKDLSKMIFWYLNHIYEDRSIVFQVKDRIERNMCMHNLCLYSGMRRWHPEEICPFKDLSTMIFCYLNHCDEFNSLSQILPKITFTLNWFTRDVWSVAVWNTPVCVFLIGWHNSDCWCFFI